MHTIHTKNIYSVNIACDTWNIWKAVDIYSLKIIVATYVAQHTHFVHVEAVCSERIPSKTRHLHNPLFILTFSPFTVYYYYYYSNILQICIYDAKILYLL